MEPTGNVVTKEVPEEQRPEIPPSHHLLLQKKFLITGGLICILVLLFGAKVLFMNTDQPSKQEEVSPVIFEVTPTDEPIIFEESTPTASAAPSSMKQPTKSSFTPTPTPDKEPPTLRGLYFPQQNGVMDYRVEGKYCAIANSPRDNVTATNDIEITYQFDEGSWSSYAKQNGYYCTDSLSNGQHTLRVKAKDQAGNESGIETHNFTVNIN